MWGDPTFFHRTKTIENNIEKRYILTKTIEKKKKNIEKR